MNLAGVDGCRRGWVVARADAALGGLTVELVARLGDLFNEAAAGGDIVAIDIPIGLPETGRRECDGAARIMLGFPRSSSVFSPPSRASLAATGYREACLLNTAACGRMLSQQSYHILPKIREVDALITPDSQRYVREVHPELVFALLAGGGHGLLLSKKTPAGEAERLLLLAPFFPELATKPGTDPIAAIRERLGRRRVARDDIVDALACLVAARRIHADEALVLPAREPERDARGLHMEIVA